MITAQSPNHNPHTHTKAHRKTQPHRITTDGTLKRGTRRGGAISHNLQQNILVTGIIILVTGIIRATKHVLDHQTDLDQCYCAMDEVHRSCCKLHTRDTK